VPSTRPDRRPRRTRSQEHSPPAARLRADREAHTVPGWPIDSAFEYGQTPGLGACRAAGPWLSLPSLPGWQRIGRIRTQPPAARSSTTDDAERQHPSSSPCGVPHAGPLAYAGVSWVNRLSQRGRGRRCATIRRKSYLGRVGRPAPAPSPCSLSSTRSGPGVSSPRSSLQPVPHLISQVDVPSFQPAEPPPASPLTRSID
jgi:hypothetical protein